MTEPETQRRKDFRLTVHSEQRLAARIWRLHRQIVPDNLPSPPSDSLPATVLNISAGGMAARFETPPRMLAVGDFIGIELQRENLRLALVAQVRHAVDTPGRSSKVGVAFLFDQASLEGKKQAHEIQKLMAEVQREQLQNRWMLAAPATERRKNESPPHHGK